MKDYQSALEVRMMNDQAKCDKYNEKLIEDGKREPDREWRGTPVFHFGNRAMRRHPNKSR